MANIFLKHKHMYVCIFLCAHAHTQSKVIAAPSKNLCLPKYLP